MEKHYRKIEFSVGNTIDSAVKELKEHKDLVYGIFNGKELYSDIDDIDSAYKKITGKTKADFDAELKLENDRFKEEERKHKEAIPELTKEWIEKGKAILDEKYHEFWIKCVPIRLADLYRGFELGCCLDIVKELNAGCSNERAEEIIIEQGHSGMSFGLMCSMLKSFCNRGNQFVDYLKESGKY